MAYLKAHKWYEFPPGSGEERCSVCGKDEETAPLECEGPREIDAAPTPGPDARAPEETRYVCFHCHAEVRASDEGTVGHSCLRDEGLRRATSDHDLAPVAVEAMIRKQAIEEAATELERYGRCPDRETWTTAAAWLRGLALRSSLSGDPEVKP